MTAPGLPEELNTLTITGRIASAVKTFEDGVPKAVFTLQNAAGRFYVEWENPDIWLYQGNNVVVYGSLYSVQKQNTDASRIKARTVFVV